MRYARKLTLLAVTALAAMAMMTGTASAQDPVEVIDNATQAHCAPTCVTHATGENIQLFAHVPFFGEIHQYTCNNEYDLTIDENGEGSIDGFAFTPPSSGTSPQNCLEIVACETPWTGHASETAGEESLVANVCIVTPVVECEGDIVLDINQGPSGVTAEAVNEPIAGSVCEIQGENGADGGHWDLEGDPISLVH